jgi:hypothetical protein
MYRREGIMRPFKLSESDFRVESVESDGERFFPVYNPHGAKRLLETFLNNTRYRRIQPDPTPEADSAIQCEDAPTITA